MVYLAAALAGMGGLLLELLYVRRLALVMGNTAGATALVLAVFLLGLGLGGLLLPRLRAARRRPLVVAAVLYAAVSFTALAGEWVLARTPPLGATLGAGLCLLLPGIPALLMGGAFPMLFTALPRHAATWRGGLLVGTNTLGSVVATFVGGNFVISRYGFWTMVLAGASAYGAAALAVILASLSHRPLVAEEPPPFPRPSHLDWAAAASGFLVLGIEVLMVRRLPFFLDGFQPTLTGVIAACLLALTLGAWFGPPILVRVFGARAVGGSVLSACLVAGLGLHEWLAPMVGRVGVDSDAGMHLRIVAAALVATGLPCFLLGATIPLCLAEYRHPETRAPLAGRLFFFQGVGSLAGALVMGHLLPLLLPRSFFIWSLPILALSGLAVVARGLGWRAVLGAVVIALLGWAGVTGGSRFRHDPAPVAGSRYDHPERYRYLDHRTDNVVTASVVYDRQSSGMILFTDEFRAAYIGADSGYMKVLGHLPFLLRRGLARTAVIALGTGTTANSVSLWPDPETIDLVEISPAVVSLVDSFASDGPGVSDRVAPFRLDPRTAGRIHVTDGRHFIASRPVGSLDLISMEPLLPYAPGTVPLYSAEFYELCGKALSEQGLMVQWLPTHSMPRDYFETLLWTFAANFEHHSVWLVNQSTILVGSKQPHLPGFDELKARMEAVPAAVRKDLHEAGIATAEDLAVAFVTDDVREHVYGFGELHDYQPMLESVGYWSGGRRLQFLPDNLGVLLNAVEGSWPTGEDWQELRVDRVQGLQDLARGRNPIDPDPSGLAVLSLARARSRQPGSVLLFEEGQRARRTDAYRRLRQQLGDIENLDDAALARVDRRRLGRFLRGDPGNSFMWAVQALLAEDPVASRGAAMRALALDPTFYLTWPVLWPAHLPGGDLEDYRGPLEDLFTLPANLVGRASGDSPETLAFATRFRVPVGYAFLDALGERALRAEETMAFRTVLDPAMLNRALSQIRGRGGDLVGEFLPLWREDFAAPQGLEILLQGSVDRRIALGTALAGRLGAQDLDLLGTLLLDSDAGVRRVAGVSLFQSVGAQIEYDPEWDETRRQKAAEQLRQLNENR